MNRFIAYPALYLPATLARGELFPYFYRQYLRHESFSSEKLLAYQQARLAKLLQFAQRNSPYYRNLFQEYGLSFNGRFSWDDFRRIPFLTKADLQDKKEEVHTWRSSYSHSKTTGGSTGQAVTLTKNPTALARERAATARAYRWAGVHPGDPQARFWGVPIVHSGKIASAITDIAANRVRISAFGFSEDGFLRAADTISRFHPVYLYGYASMICEFAEFMAKQKKRLPNSVKSVITTSEVLTGEMREKINANLGIPVYNEYGCGEVGSIAHECEQGSLHTMADNIFIELIDESGAAADSGELVVTDFHNFATPIIRYRLGDYATLLESSCACGRSLPTLDSVHGRAYDVIRTPDGKKFHPESVMYIFELLKNSTTDIRQFQVIQRSERSMTVRLVTTSGANTALLEKQIATEIRRTICSEFEFTFEYVDGIERERSGKLRLVKSEVESSIRPTI